MIAAQRAQFLCRRLASDRSAWLIIGSRKGRTAAEFGNNKDHEKLYASDKEFRVGSGRVMRCGNSDKCAEHNTAGYPYNSDSIAAATARGREGSIKKGSAPN